MASHLLITVHLSDHAAPVLGYSIGLGKPCWCEPSRDTWAYLLGTLPATVGIEPADITIRVFDRRAASFRS